MADWRKFFDKEFLYAYDFDGGRDVTLTIDKVAGGELKGENGKTDKKPIVTFRETKKKLALNKTNGSTIASLYGNDVEKWVGKRITLYPTTTTFGRQTVECIRVRPKVPNGKSAAPPATMEPTPNSAPPEVDDVDAMAARDQEPAS